MLFSNLHHVSFNNIICVTNPVCGLPPDSHQRSPLHHINSHTTQHTGLHFPSSIALTTHTHTQLITLITLTAENYHTIKKIIQSKKSSTTITQSLSPNHTLFISLGLSFCDRRVLYCVYPSDSYSTEPIQ